MLSYFLLALSIGLELFATTMLKASDGFTRPLQTIACVCLCRIFLYIDACTEIYSSQCYLCYLVWRRSRGDGSHFGSLSLVRAIIFTLY